LWEEFSNQNPSREDLRSIIKDDESSSELKEKAGRMFIDKKNPDKEDLRLIFKKVWSLRTEIIGIFEKNYQTIKNNNLLGVNKKNNLIKDDFCFILKHIELIIQEAKRKSLDKKLNLKEDDIRNAFNSIESMRENIGQIFLKRKNENYLRLIIKKS
jgi:hypothetical protein